MEVRAFRAASIQDALQLVRRELGPDASLLEARALGEFMSPHERQVEVLASNHVHVPSQFEAACLVSDDRERFPTLSQADAYRRNLALTSDCGGSIANSSSSSSNGRSEGSNSTVDWVTDGFC